MHAILQTTTRNSLTQIGASSPAYVTACQHLPKPVAVCSTALPAVTSPLADANDLTLWPECLSATTYDEQASPQGTPKIL